MNQLQNVCVFTSSYRYGYQGQEKDDEIKGEGNSVNYKYRMHDPRIGRFFAVDPLAPKYPHNSPYAFSENSVIAFTELEGLEKISAITLGAEGNHRINWFVNKYGTKTDGTKIHYQSNNMLQKVIEAIVNTNNNLPEDWHISYIPIFSHGVDGIMSATNSVGEYGQSIYVGDYFSEGIKQMVEEADINFGGPLPLMYLGACNGGTPNEAGKSSASSNAELFGIPVVAVGGNSCAPFKDKGDGDKYFGRKDLKGGSIKVYFPDGHVIDMGTHVGILKEVYDVTQGTLDLSHPRYNKWNEVYQYYRQNIVPSITKMKMKQGSIVNTTETPKKLRLSISQKIDNAIKFMKNDSDKGQ